MNSISSATIDSLAQQYRTSQRGPIVPVENQKTTLNARINAIADLKARMDALFSVVSDLSLGGVSSKFLSYTATSSQTNILTVSASSAAAKGTHAISVTQLAKSDTLASSQLSTDGADIIGTEGPGLRTIRLSVNGTTTDVNVTLQAGDSNSTIFSKIADAVNASGAAVTASVVNDTQTTSKLVFTSTAAGSTNAVSLADVTGGVLNALGLSSSVISGRTAATGTTGGYLYSAPSSLDAKFNVDGIDIVRSTNTVTDVLKGVTLNLAGTQLGTDAPVSITIGVDHSAIRAKIDSFITAYNDVVTTLTDKTAVDSDTQVRQIFAGDFMFRNLRSQVRAIGSGVVDTVQAGNPRMLADIGIKTNADGTLTVSNAETLNNALDSDISKVSDIFNSSNGIAVRLKTLVDGFVSIKGQLNTTTDSLTRQVKSLTDQITRFDAQLDTRVTRFRDDFAAAQNAIALASQQQQMVQSILAGGFF
jgi:flagellar hook-associated protein 2